MDEHLEILPAENNNGGASVHDDNQMEDRLIQ